MPLSAMRNRLVKGVRLRSKEHYQIGIRSGYTTTRTLCTRNYQIEQPALLVPDTSSPVRVPAASPGLSMGALATTAVRTEAHAPWAMAGSLKAE